MENTQYSVKPLTVYKASAGSGKTFTLAAEYIKLLIDNPHAYENILAVTFTNKATEEMKSRILSQLYGIANGLEDSNDYLEKICVELGVEEKFVRSQAKIALRLLLHNYNFFRVQTIDTFFQGVMRNLAKELSLSNNLRISLNDKQVIGQAVDAMMEKMIEDKQLMSWVEEYIDDSMNDEKSWNITEDVKSFGGNLTKEFFKDNRVKLDKVFEDPKFFENYKKKLNALIKGLEEKYKAIGEEFMALLVANGLEVGDFSNKDKGVAGYFVRLSNGIFYDQGKSQMVGSRVSDAMFKDQGWCNKSSQYKDTILALANEKLKPLFHKTEASRAKDERDYNSAKKTLDNMNKLRLLHSIEKEILLQNGEHSRFMLSNTQTLLNEMIGEDSSVAPFIFEKIGSKITHIMIDEFQDTSNVQWKNFKVLLENCMANPKFAEDNPHQVTNNLIVGDVKQSIYRFRSGDWRLLNNIDETKTGFSPEQVFVTSLQTNYRSERNIIDFNNLFFKAAAKHEADRIMSEDEVKANEFITKSNFQPEVSAKKKEWAQDIRKAYADVCQLIPKKKESKGLVKVKLITGSNDDTREEILGYMLDNIKVLLDNNVEMKDIAILVRNNKSIPTIAEYFSQEAPEINLVSEEAFRLDSSIAIMMIVSGMKYLAHPNDKGPKATLAKFYVQYLNNKKSKGRDDIDILLDKDNLASYLPALFQDDSERHRMLSMPLSELTEKLLRELHLGDLPGQTIYISTFFDKLNSYVADNAGVLEEFLEYWDEELCSKTVSVGNINGIRIMSMHKSKGLEFDHVIIPYCNWSLLPPFAETLWCNVDEEPFNDLPFIPVNYTNESSLKNSIYELDGSEEAMQEIVDNLNLLYVAFTRAGKSLIVVGNVESKGKNDNCFPENRRSMLIAHTLKECYNEMEKLMGTELYKKNLDNILEFKDEEDTMSMELTFGSLTIREKENKNTENVFLRPTSNIEVRTESHENEAIQFRQSNKSRDFANDTTEDNDDKLRFIHNGTILHQIFSSIDTLDDVDNALKELEFNGLLYNEDTTPEMLKSRLRKKFANPQIADWFSNRWQVFNECTILYADENGKIVDERPDRVITDGEKTIVVDYKFGSENEDYKKQVRKYMNRLVEMNMPNVEGYIWYVNRNKVVPVDQWALDD